MNDIKVDSWVRFKTPTETVIRGKVKQITNEGIAIVQEAIAPYAYPRGVKMCDTFYEVPIFQLDVICAPQKVL